MKKDSTLVQSITSRLRVTEPTLADAGFTAAVIARLPRSDNLPIWQKNVILLTGTALGSATVAWQVPLSAAPELLATAAANWLILLGTAVLVTYSAAAAAVWTERR